jgi:uncharacterized membrane protein
VGAKLARERAIDFGSRKAGQVLRSLSSLEKYRVGKECLMLPLIPAPRSQRGAIGLMAALTLGVALLFMLLVIDSGRLYLEQRKLQRVADMAALAAANQSAVCSGTGINALTAASANAVLNGHTVGTDRTLAVSCGTLLTGANNVRTFSPNATSNQAIKVVATNTVTTSVAGGLWALMSTKTFNAKTALTATAVAATAGQPLAQLNIRSTLVSVDTAKSALLNPLFSGLLGGSVSLDAVGWNGLVDTKINLLSYMDQLAINLGVSAGNYNSVLSANATVTQLIQAAIDVLRINGAAASVTSSLGALQVGSANTTLVTLGDVLKLQNGTTAAGLNANMQLFDLAQAFIQLANSKSALAATVPINLLGLANVTTQIKVIEPPQYSAVGNPILAKANPTGQYQIYVRTAQVRLLTSVKLPLVDAALNVLNPLLSTAVGALNIALAADLGCSLGHDCTKTDLYIIPSASIDIGLEAASGSSYVTDYQCSATTKSLTAAAESAAATLRLGTIDPNNYFSSTQPVSVSPLILVDIRTTHCNPGCGARVSLGGGGLIVKANSKVLATQTTPYTFQNPPNVGQPTSPLHAYPAPQDAVSSLSGTLSGIQVVSPTATTPTVLGSLLSVVTSLLAGAINNLTSLISGALSPLLDPLINSVLSLLGINLNEVDVGANLTCNTGRAALVI